VTTAFGMVEAPPILDDRSGSIVDERAALAAKLWAEHNDAGDAGAFHDVTGDETAILTANARVSDLSFVPRPGSDPDRQEPAYVNGLLFESGRPVLVVPPRVGGNWMNNAVVVWNGSAQAARALAGAMPLLKLAKEVTVVSFGPEKSRASILAVMAYLARHGIRAKGDGVNPGSVSARGRGRAVIEYAEKAGAGLTVMGAFGESGVMSFLGLGGATGKVITGTRTPLLLAH
jgi:nucleotide-binding universal stress UspA family protein